MAKRAVFKKSRRELSLDVSVGVHILLVVEQSSLESQSRGCAKTPILTVFVQGRSHFELPVCQCVQLALSPYDFNGRLAISHSELVSFCPSYLVCEFASCPALPCPPVYVCLSVSCLSVAILFDGTAYS